MKLPSHQIINQQQTEAVLELCLALSLPPDMVYFDGHFDEQPILPAVAQIFMVRQLADHYWDLPVVCAGAKQLKFKATIAPEEAVQLHMSYDPDAMKLNFSYQVTGVIKSKGTILYKQREGS